ncbi:alpha/beta fold hydrolase [Jannaschia pohangensis]|uniref:Alpha/beta hydrolase family protein n=1 Tax=Jannaschia pohangensis TaxID=390807 RepID=A0A1I3MDV2_9RHOB|nr:alpha/beta fold hydrolase [Jannaschia pohangensis]SFI95141.1 Alpha/beta hydrolase family protein [Jannaschia pohangensis]
MAPLFFHGLPGGPEDRRLLDRKWRPDEMMIGDTLCPDAPGTTPRHLVGFSLGAFAALGMAARHPDRVARLTLISPAGPLQSGDFLPQMAGAPVFRLARRSATGLRVLTALQGGITRIAPDRLLRQLFSTSHPAERAILDDAAARDVLRAGLRHCHIDRPRAYCDSIAAYVTDWRDDLGAVRCPVTIWQGDADRWTPPDMARSLANALCGPVDLRIVTGAGHYGMLRRALP